jgi:hypothetical protein
MDYTVLSNGSSMSMVNHDDGLERIIEDSILL